MSTSTSVTDIDYNNYTIDFNALYKTENIHCYYYDDKSDIICIDVERKNGKPKFEIKIE